MEKLTYNTPRVFSKNIYAPSVTDRLVVLFHNRHNNENGLQ